MKNFLRSATGCVIPPGDDGISVGEVAINVEQDRSLVGNVWAQQNDKLAAKDATSNAMQGHSVALSADGNTAIVSGLADGKVTGAAWVFTRSGDTSAVAETEPPTYRSISALEGYCER